MNIHIPVLVQESIRALDVKAGHMYVDATYGGGGHTAEILKNHGKVIAFDKDHEALSVIHPSQDIIPIHDDFRNLKKQLMKKDIHKVSGVVADLGISSIQLDSNQRGFSYRWDAPLDMRFNRQSRLTAFDVINRYPQEKLADMFYRYGEVTGARALASQLTAARKRAPLKTTFSLREIALSVFHGANRQQYLSKVFQAVRIEVNDELQALKDLLTACAEVITKGGRLAVITYHSLEDRIVKYFIAHGNFTPYPEKDLYGHLHAPFAPISKKPITPSEQETDENIRARSAKLRAGIKL